MKDDANTGSSPPPTKRPFQYGLRSLFVLTTVVALLLGLTTWLGFGGFLLSLLILAGVASYYRSWTIAFFLFGFTVLVPCLIPPSSGCREAARRVQCMNNLKQLGVALLTYHDAHGSFPPAYVADKNGKPMHSWRVLILPYLDCGDLHKRYRFDEPWDGPNNRKLHGEIVNCFRCPSKPARHDPYATSYVAVVGPRTAWRGDQPVKLSDFTDATDVTILLVEMKNSGIHWMEPRDLDYPPMPTQINPPATPGISSPHFGGAVVLFADGSIAYLSDGAKIVDALLTIDGGEAVSEDGSP